MSKEKISFWFPFAVVFFEIATYLANDMYLPGLPSLRVDFNISQSVAQDTLLYWFLGSASMQLLMGPLSDRYGRKIVLVGGALAFTTASLICAYTHHIIPFLLARFIQGCAVCSVVVAGYSAIHELYDSKIAIKTIAIMGSVVVLAPAFGPIFGALIIEIAHWRTIFYILGLAGLLSIIWLAKATPSQQTPKITINLNVILRDYVAIGTRKHFLVFTLPFCFMFLALICWIVETPFLIIEIYKKTAVEYGLVQLYVFGSFIIGAQITSQLIHKLEAITLIKIGLMISLIAALNLVIFSFFGYQFYVLVGWMMIVALGFAMTFGPLSRLAIESCQEPMGSRMAIFSSYMSLFGVFATLLVGLFENNTMTNLATMIALGTIIAFLVFFSLKKPLLVMEA